MAEKYVIGLDYGTLSGRAILVNAENGRTVAQSVKNYTHGVLEKALPDGTPLPAAWALAVPADYLEVLTETLPKLLVQSGVKAEDIVGIGLDVTASTFLPVDRDGIPLCEKAEYAARPHAWMKLWKHHAAQPQADRMTALARERNEDFLKWYGGAVNAEWTLPKLLQIAEEDPEICREADCFMEAGDWLVMRLTGERTRSMCIAGYKLQYRKAWTPSESAAGYPDRGYLNGLSPLLADVVAEKLGGQPLEPGEMAGRLTAAMAERLGLLPGTPVAAAAIDAHASVPGVGICRPGELLMVLGTSCCAMLCSEQAAAVPGIFGMVKDGILPGYYGYEAGQSSVGDTFDWFVRNCVPESYVGAARNAGIEIHWYLKEKAGLLRAGESGLLALDWWNGNRSCLADANLKGMILGLDLATKPEHIYRALIESCAYGMRTIMEAFEAGGVKVERVYACGGIAKKNPLMMQIYADVLDREIRVGSSDQSSALGAAMFGAVAAGVYPSVTEAAKALGRVEDYFYRPVQANAAVYSRLYQEYSILHDYFGRGENDVMKRIRCLW